MIDTSSVTVLANGREDLSSPAGWLPLMLPLLILVLALVNWSVILVRRLSSQATQQRWLEKKFDGKDLVEIYSPATNLPRHHIALIAYNRGYVFARSYATSRDFNHTYVFRKLFSRNSAHTIPNQGPVIQ